MKKVNVLLFIFNRPVHTETTLTELLKQKEYIDTIHINVDFPRTERDRLLQDKTVSLVKRIFKNEEFSNVVWHNATENMGIAKSVVGLTNYMTKITSIPTVVIEDDVVPLPGFMKYMSYYLYKYFDDSEIYTVCGYQYKESDMLNCIENTPIIDVEKTSRFNPWGWGYWPHKWRFEWLKSITEEELSVIPKSVSEFLRLKEFQTGSIDVWSTTVIFKQYTHNLKTIIPTVSLVENIGFDGTGVHSDVTNVFTKAKVINIEPIIIKVDNLKINEDRETEIEEFLLENLRKVMFNKVKV